MSVLLGLWGVFHIARYLIRMKEPFKTNYDSDRDNFKHWMYLVLPCAVLCIFVNDGLMKYGISSYIFEVTWVGSGREGRGARCLASD